MRIVALVKSQDHVCSRYRIAAYRPFLEAAGHTLEIVPWPRSWLSRLLLQRHVGRPDVLLLQRKMPAPWQLALLRRVTGALLFDFDDAIFLNNSFDPRGLLHPGRASQFRRIVQAVDAVVAGNTFLRDQALLWTEPERVTVIPTCVPVQQYHQTAERADIGTSDLVWIGSSSTLPTLEPLRASLELAGQRWPGLRLKIICDRFPAFDKLQVLRCPWSATTERRELASAVIGLSWLPDDLWSRGKCGLKVLQYMAAGLPVLANAVGLQSELVQSGQTGFLVRTGEQWIDALELLLNNPELRQHMGTMARRLVTAHYDVAVGAQKWLALLQQLETGHFQRRFAHTG
jgi:glycosyltransferase involved in cell wall biosynthesis